MEVTLMEDYFKRFLSVVLTLCMLASTVCFSSGLVYAADATDTETVQISNADELYAFAERVNNGETTLNAVLTADIVVNEGEITAGSTSAKIWTPIGSSKYSYKGVFDGNNHTISGLYFNDSNIDYVGLFGSTGSKAEIKNVGVINSYFSGKSYVGGVCGRNYSGTISNSYNTGTVIGSSYYVGGVCGRNSGTISNSYNMGVITGGAYYVGGICGSNDGTISNSYNMGAVTGSSSVGGVCGSNGGTISNSYNTGTVKGRSYVGGVCGQNTNRTISNSYNTGTIALTLAVGGEACYVGGVCGYNKNGTISDSYNEGEVTGDYGSSGYVGGVCGYNYYGTISTSYNTGAVTGSYENVGGVCGYNKNGTISNSYNTGAVTGSSDYVGGVCGYNYDGTISNSYNIGVVTSKYGSSYVGGVCGVNYGTITNCFYLVNTASKAVGSGRVADVAVKTESEFASGEVCYLLNNSSSDDPVFYQRISMDATPILNQSRGIVYKVGTIYTNSFDLGDVNCDYKVDKLDAAIILKYISGVISETEFKESYNADAADYDKSGNVDLLDVIGILANIA
jgi:hypothetical protein